MKIYIDLVLFLNFAFDFLLLLSVSIILKRNIKLENIIYGAFIGSLSILLLFLNINSITLFLFKIGVSVLMIFATFKYKSIHYFIKNIIFFYLSSIILGGFLYMLNIEFSYKNNGLVFYHNGLSINFIILIIFSPVIIYIYIKQLKTLKTNYNNYYKVKINYKNEIIKVNAYLDTGNKLESNYKKKPVILLNQKLIKDIDIYTYISFNTINGKGVIKCIKASIIIDNVTYKDVLIGLTDNIKIEDVDCILNQKILEEK